MDLVLTLGMVLGIVSVSCISLTLLAIAMGKL